MSKPKPGTLQAFMAAHPDLTIAELAERSGIHESGLHELMASRRWPGRRTVVRLHAATAGAIDTVDIGAFVANDRRRSA